MNLEQIARLSGVSRSTVSRVINNDPNVSTVTRDAVLRVVRLMNYVPNATARGLARGSTQVIGLVIQTGVSALFTNPFFSLLIQGVSSACAALGQSVMLWLAAPTDDHGQMRQIIQSGVIDGVLLASTLIRDPLVQTLYESQQPFVLIGRHPIQPDVNCVDVENRGGACEAVRHLLRLGRTRIATITGPQNTIAGMDRLTGYFTALRERGLKLDADLVVAGDFTEIGGYLAMQQLLPHQPDAVFAASDVMALGALRAIREAGRRVPEEIGIVSFEDSPLAACAEPPLTVIRQPAEQLGRTAVEMLIEMIRNPAVPTHQVVLPTELIIRASCGATQQ